MTSASRTMITSLTEPRRLVSIVALAATLSGCGGATPTPSAPPTATPTASVTLTPSVTPTPSSTPTPTFPADAIVRADGLNVRAGPDTLHPALDVVLAGTPVAVRGRNDDTSWLAVRTVNEREGWLAARFVELRRAESSIPTLATPSPPPTPTATPVPLDPALPLVVAPPAVAQGDTLVVRLRSPGVGQAVAALGNATAALLPVGPDTFAGLLGIPVDLPPGAHSVFVTATDSGGNPADRSIDLTVHDAGYAAEEIVLDEDTLSLLDPAVREPEYLRLVEVWSVATPERLWDGVWGRPVTGTISSAFGTARLYNDGLVTGRHTGADFRGATGTPVIAPARGRVALAEPLEARGNSVWLDHGWGVYSGYFHLDTIEVEPGAIVERGTRLGTVGATGTTTGPHLHWEVRVQGVEVQPLAWLARDFSAVP